MKNLLFLIILFSSVACKQSSEKNLSKSSKSIVQYAEFFQLTEKDGQMILYILSPETKKVEQSFVINIEKPIMKVACLSATHIGMLQKLKLVNRIGAISNSLYVYNPQLLKNIVNHKVVELGEEMQIPMESLVNSGCQAVFYSGFGKEFSHSDLLKKIGISCIVNYDWRETHPLGKAEWILLFGYLMGKPAEAHAVFEDVKSKYLALKANKTTPENRPVVISGNMWGDQWNAPAGESYHSTLLKDAGANYIYSNTKGTGSVQYSFEKIIQDSKGAEFWLNTGIPSKKLILASNPKLENLAVFQSGKIYDYSKSGNRYWEMSAIEPHKVLEDYIHLFNQSKLNQLHFYNPVN
jgi:iron complex transport system substrate-binding protein